MYDELKEYIEKHMLGSTSEGTLNIFVNLVRKYEKDYGKVVSYQSYKDDCYNILTVKYEKKELYFIIPYDLYVNPNSFIITVKKYDEKPDEVYLINCEKNTIQCIFQ